MPAELCSCVAVIAEVHANSPPCNPARTAAKRSLTVNVIGRARRDEVQFTKESGG
jgi:hypothetical protein